jgi:hypothetical protein
VNAEGQAGSLDHRVRLVEEIAGLLDLVQRVEVVRSLARDNARAADRDHGIQDLVLGVAQRQRGVGAGNFQAQLLEELAGGLRAGAGEPSGLDAHVAHLGDQTDHAREVLLGDLTKGVKLQCNSWFHPTNPFWRRPGDCVGDDRLDLLLVEDREGLVPRAEVEDLAGTTVEAAATAEDVATLKPTDENLRVRRRNVEALAVHLDVRNLEVFWQPLGDGVTGLYHPDTLFLPRLAPLQIASRAHQRSENLGEVTRVQHDKTHPCQDAGLDLGDDLIVNLAVSHMAPPDQHIGISQHLIGQPVLRLIQRGGLHIVVGLKEVGDGHVDAIGIDIFHHIVDPLMSELIPNRNFDRTHLP